MRHQEVKQHKEEWKLVMRKLAIIASIVINVSKMCEKYNLNEEGLPTSLLALLGSLQRLVFLRRPLRSTETMVQRAELD